MDSFFENGRESCRLIPLHPYSTPLQSIRMCNNHKATYRKVTNVTGTPYFKDESPTSRTTESADLLFRVPCTWIKARPYNCDPLDLAIIHDTCSITANILGTVQGTTPAETITASVDTVRERMSSLTGDYSPPASYHSSTCHLCSYPDTDTKCNTPTCENRTHKRCLSNTSSWSCGDCTQPTLPSLTSDQASLLFERSLTHPIYSASDGSVRGANTNNPSSTFGVCIDPLNLNFTSGGKFSIRQGEECSLRAELEALIHAYHLIPTGIDVIHAVDNMTAIDIHNTLCTTGLSSRRSLINKHYHSTITRLHTAMAKRGSPLTITHTLSHLEHVVSNSPSLNGRRSALARADKAADTYHASLPIRPDPSGTEPFPLTIGGIIVEKKSKTPFPLIQMNLRRKLLCSKRFEGANHRTEATPGWSTGSKHWPSFLTTFRHKLITRRLPNAYNRSITPGH